MMDVPNADILFLYDAKLCNPNGDPDEENKPRMDELTRRCLVSDVRLKRYLRDYWLSNGAPGDVWVRTQDEGTLSANPLSANQRLSALYEKYRNEGGGGDKKSAHFKAWLLDNLTDVRLFGAVMPIKGEKGGEGDNITFTGPVQFNWGYSLHPVEVVLSSSITSTFAGREEGTKGEHGTMGKDWRIHYGLIAFHGHVSKARAKHTRMKPEDLNLLEEGLLRAIPHEATSRSKLGQVPRLYLRVSYKDSMPPIGDPRDYLDMLQVDSDEPLRNAEKIRDAQDYRLSLQRLVEVLRSYQNQVAGVRFWSHPQLRLVGDEDLGKLPHFERV